MTQLVKINANGRTWLVDMEDCDFHPDCNRYVSQFREWHSVTDALTVLKVMTNE